MKKESIKRKEVIKRMDNYLGMLEGVQQLTGLIKNLYDAYMQQGFSEVQAMTLCCAHIKAIMTSVGE